MTVEVRVNRGNLMSNLYKHANLGQHLALILIKRARRTDSTHGMRRTASSAKRWLQAGWKEDIGMQREMLLLFDQWARASFLSGWLKARHGSNAGRFADSGVPSQIQNGLEKLEDLPLTDPRTGLPEKVYEKWFDLANQGFYEEVLFAVYMGVTRKFRLSPENVMELMQDLSADMLNTGEGFHSMFYNGGIQWKDATLDDPGSIKKAGKWVAGNKTGGVLGILETRARSYYRQQAQQRELERTEKDVEEYYSGGGKQHLINWNAQDMKTFLLGEVFLDEAKYNQLNWRDEGLWAYVAEPAKMLVDKMRDDLKNQLNDTQKRVLNVQMENMGKSTRDIAQLAGVSQSLVSQSRKVWKDIVNGTMRRNSKLVDALDFRIKSYIAQGTGGHRSWVPGYGSSRPGRGKAPETSIISRQASDPISEMIVRVATRAAFKKQPN